MRLLRLALVSPEAGEAQCGAEFPGFGLLLTCDGKCSVKVRFCFCGILLRRFERDFPGNAMDLGLKPSFVGLFHSR